ncbi:MAG: hypothetical protein C0478_09705 [Planctomyces sp.]|nr:hypothetical protein [Planctomyces sp.]
MMLDGNRVQTLKDRMEAVMSGSFEDRLAKAIQRGNRQREEEGSQRAKAARTDEDYRQQHGSLRIELSDHIESAIKKMVSHFPGFNFKTVVSPDGWGAHASRDDVAGTNRRDVTQLYSYLEILVRPYSSTARIIDVVVRGTIRNKEILRRNEFSLLDEADPTNLRALIDQWVVQYAERYAARG